MRLTTLLQADPLGRLAGDPLKIMIMDTETTGFAARDRILQFSACLGNGRTLVNELFKPEGIKSWPRAQQVNGISPEQVKDARTFREAGERCRSLMAGMQAIAGWNLGYDLRMMRQSGVEPPQGPAYIDLMRLLPSGLPGSKSLE
ncbi:MAG: 3'-5' exonuclease, partial [Desulfovibrio sp.]|nr:3'-5' exonuclease [Desulfovibrio sp.]